MCEKQTPCFLSCQATSYLPFNYSWTKDGQVPTGDGIKLMNNSIIVTPRDGKGYGEYVCRVTNSFGSTDYKITLLSPKDNRDDDRKYSQNGKYSIRTCLNVFASNILESLELFGVYGLLITVFLYNQLCIKSNIIRWSHKPTLFCVKLHFFASVRKLLWCAMQVDHSYIKIGLLGC